MDAETAIFRARRQPAAIIKNPNRGRFYRNKIQKIQYKHIGRYRKIDLIMYYKYKIFVFFYTIGTIKIWVLLKNHNFQRNHIHPVFKYIMKTLWNPLIYRYG